MTADDYLTVCLQLSTLKEIEQEYGGTIGNTIQQLESRKEWYEQHHKEKQK